MYQIESYAVTDQDPPNYGFGPPPCILSIGKEIARRTGHRWEPETLGSFYEVSCRYQRCRHCTVVLSVFRDDPSPYLGGKPLYRSNLHGLALCSKLVSFR